MLRVFLLVVVGLAGAPEHGKTFQKWGATFAEAAGRIGVSSERLAYLVDQPAGDDTRVTGRATREDIARALDGFAKSAGPEDVVFITLIGHGTFDGRTPKFNLQGPDMTPADFDALLKKLPTRQIVFVNAASSSGPFIEVLSGPGRTIVTATRSGAEYFTTLFGGYFVDALTSEAADADKNKRISVLEAFRYAKAEVARAYERQGLLVTEHALLDDDGDKQGSPDPSPAAKDGKVAAVVSFGVAGDETLPSDPRLRALHLERRELERRVESLRLLKESMPPARYETELEALATALALKTREIRAAEP